MRSLLVHNPEAGYGQVDAAGLLGMIARAGHDVIYQSSKVDDLAASLDQPVDLVVVAGGDGTATKIAKLSAGRRTPLALLPLGSANNLARAVGHYGPLEDLIKAWDLRSVQPVDIGSVSGDWGSSRFAESFGVGLMAAAIIATDKGDADKARSKFDNAADRLAAGMKMLRKCVRQMNAVEVTIGSPDGRRTESLLWAEVAMVNTIGPGLPLFDSQDLADGMVSYALLPASERDTFAASLGDRIEGRAPARTGLITGCAANLTLSWADSPAHLDGTLLPDPPSDSPSGRAAEVTVQPKAVRFLKLRAP